MVIKPFRIGRMGVEQILEFNPSSSAKGLGPNRKLTWREMYFPVMSFFIAPREKLLSVAD